MEFKYTVNPYSDEPIMLIDKHIGYDENDGYGVMADQFTRELLALDNQGVKKVQVWINSPGGQVTEGQQIAFAILNSACKVDTYCMGVAASIALPIFLSGRKRYMADYALLMTHPVSGGSFEVTQKFRNSIITLVSGRSTKSKEELTSMMNRTTWMDVSEAIEYGMCDEIIISSEANRKNLRLENTINRYCESKAIINSILKDLNNTTNKEMEFKKVTNKLGLVEGANEEVILASIEAIENKLTAKNSEVEALNNKVNALEEEKASKEAELKTLKDEKEAAELEATKAKEETIKNSAKAMIEVFAKEGRIKNESETIEKWTNKAIVDFEGVKEMIEDLPLNKVGPKIIAQNNTEVNTYNVGAIMANITAKNKN